MKKVLKKLSAIICVLMLITAPCMLTNVHSKSTSDIASQALRKVGCRYVFGSCHSMSSIRNSGQRTFDCSGLVSWACYHAGYNIGSNTTKTLIHKGTGISYSNMRRGDIMLFAHYAGGRNPCHTAIYLGNGKMVHAPYTGARVRVETISSSRRGRFITARRLSVNDIEKETTTTTTTTNTRTDAKKDDDKVTYAAGVYKVTKKAPARKAPNKESKKIGSIPSGTVVKVSTIKNDRWAKVRYNDHTAYFSLVNATKTTSSSADNEIVVGSGSSQYPAGTYKSTNKLIVRASASEKGKKVGTLKPRTLLKVTRVVNGKWCKITYNGKTAYFSMKLTKKWTKSAKAKDTFGSEKKTEKTSDKKYDKGTYKTTDTIKVFQKASTTSKKLGTLPEGTKISAKSVKNKKFVKITYNGKAAYICLTKTKKVGSSLTGKTSFKAKKTEESSSKGKYKTGTYKIVGDMKLHKTASKDGKYLELVKDKSKVKVTKVKGKWGKIKYKGKTGYVSLKYAKKL